MKKVLVISPHLDDETLGVGGTIFAHLNNGDEVYWVNVTLPKDEKKLQIRKIEQRKVELFYNFNRFFQLDFVSTTLEGQLSNLIIEFKRIFSIIEPNIVYLPNRSDAHSDHYYVFRSAFSCTKSFRIASIERILMYEVLSETEFAPSLHEYVFIPNVFINITQFMDQKIKAMNIYSNELMGRNYPRSIDSINALATLRGSRIGVRYGEAFQLIYEKI